jgi:hypothetical protein
VKRGAPLINETHDDARRSWVASAHGHPEFPRQDLPFGVFSPPGNAVPGGAVHAFIAAPLQRRRDLLFQHLFDEPANLLANLGFERIELLRSRQWHLGFGP